MESDSISETAPRTKAGLCYACVLVGAILLYVVSCAPGILWQDSGLFQYRIWHSDIEGKLGLALAHPLYIIIGIAVKWTPIGEFGYRVNLISALSAAVAVANTFLLLRLWLNRNMPAVVGAVTLAVSHTMWQHAAIAEVYTLYAALFTTELILLLKYLKGKHVGYLYLLGLFNGLSIASHMWGVIPLACYAVFVVTLLTKRQINLKNIGIIVLLWILGASSYEYLIVKSIIQSGDVTGTLLSAIFGSHWQGSVLNTSVTWQIVKENVLFMLMNFPTPNIVLVFVGLSGLFAALPSRPFGSILLVLTVVFFGFAFRYTVPDRYAFFLPFYCLASISVGVGAYLVQKRVSGRLFVYLVLVFSLLPVGAYAAAPRLAKKANVSIGTRRQIPYRDDYKYFLQPWKTAYRGPERFAREALESVEKNAIIYADSTSVFPLLYLQEVKGKGPKVKIVSPIANSEGAPIFNEETIEELLADKSVYVVSPVVRYCPAFILEGYDFADAGVLWQVVRREEESTRIKRRPEPRL